MKLSAEDYRRHYRSLSDEELLALDRGELVDVARQSYDAEIARRELAPPPSSPGSGGAEDAGPDEDFVEVGSFTSLEQLNLARELVESADIPALLPEDGSGAMHLLVPASGAETARELLQPFAVENNKALVGRFFIDEWTPDGMDLSEFAVTIEDMIAEADKVAVRMTIEGVEPGSGKSVRLGGIAMVRVADGNIAESWVGLDQRG